MAKIYIARHGQNEDNANGILNGHRDLPLTDLGINQAHELAQHISNTGIKFNNVFSSPLKRAYDTAKIVTEKLYRMDPIKLDLLIERDFGSMTGKLCSDIETLCGANIFKTNTITYFLDPPGAETFDQLKERGTEILLLLEEIKVRGNILLVCHGDIGKMIYASYYELPWQEVLSDFHFGNSELILLDSECDPEKRHVLKLQQFNH